MISPGDSGRFSVAQARNIVGDLMRPNPRIYWIDFLAAILIGHVAIHLVRFLPDWYPGAPWLVPAVVAAYVVTVVFYMRALMFIHELVHLPKNGFTGFRFAWNALCGIFLLVPSFVYYPHVDHHRATHYGTDEDGEYLSLGHRSRWVIVGYIVQALAIPLIIFLRFLILSPLCWIFPPLRKWVHRHASSLIMDPLYERKDASPSLMRVVVLQEACCFAWCVWFLCRARIWNGEWGFDPFWLVGYLVGVGVVVLNELRTLGSHRWTNEGEEMTFDEQWQDSVNYPHAPWFSELWGPVGTRFHALHHLMPKMPYHNLGRAHRLLIENLPPDSPYHQTVAKSLTSQIAELWTRATETQRPPEQALSSGE